MSSRFSRRGFLSATSLALAGTALRGRVALAHPLAHPLPNDPASTGLPADAFLPQPIDVRALAAVAIDAARAAGASYADVRVAERHTLIAQQMFDDINPHLGTSCHFKYGLRVLVDGTWGFVHGCMPSNDAMARSARDAVAMARGYSKLTKRRVELVPAPPATGEWEVAVQIDPFSVPLRDHVAVIWAIAAAASRVRNASASSGFQWHRERRVVATTEGTSVVQLLRRLFPSGGVGASVGVGSGSEDTIVLPTPTLQRASVGYEAVTGPALQDAVKRRAEEVIRLAALPRGHFDVGRYPIVLDGASLGEAFGGTIGLALEIDRALGYEADAGGTSFLSPPEQLIGTPIISPLITAVSTRAMPDISAVKWDDEGVEPDEYRIIDAGTLVDYHTTRQTAAALRSVYERRGQPVKSHGCAVAREAEYIPQVRAPTLSIAPAAQETSLDDLCRNVKRGLLVRYEGGVMTDQQLVSGAMPFQTAVYQLEQGKVTRRIYGAGLQFQTAPFWKSLVALGGRDTLDSSSFFSYKGQPWRTTSQSVHAPAGLFKDVNVISTRLAI
jgi:TldD protein